MRNRRIGITVSDRHRGNALVEFIVFAVVVIPVLVAIPILHESNENLHANRQSLRYGAWEQTVGRKNADELRNEVQQRFMVDGGMQLLHYGVEESSLGGAAATVEKVVAALGDMIGAAVPDSEWGLGGGGLIIVSTQTRVATEELDSDRCEEAALCRRGQSAILIDTWGASGPDQVANRVRSLVPAGALKPVGNMIAKVGKVLPVFQELETLEGVFGEVKPDILPANNYGKDRSLSR